MSKLILSELSSEKVLLSSLFRKSSFSNFPPKPPARTLKYLIKVPWFFLEVKTSLVLFLLNTIYQWEQLHVSEQRIPALKHSQYFFIHLVFLQLHPLKWGAGEKFKVDGSNGILGLKAKGSLERIVLTFLVRVSYISFTSCSGLL